MQHIYVATACTINIDSNNFAIYYLLNILKAKNWQLFTTKCMNRMPFSQMLVKPGLPCLFMGIRE